MFDVARLRRRWRLVTRMMASLIVVCCTLNGCRPAAPTKSTTTTPTASKSQQAADRMHRNLQNALSGLRPSEYGVVSDAERSIAVLNEWAEAAKKQAEKEGFRWEPGKSNQVIQTLPKEWIEQVTLKRFIERDAAYLRDCYWAKKASQFAAGEADNDLDLVVNLFEYVVRNVELIPSVSRKVPLGTFDVMVLGRGSVEERCWIFAELLRQRQIDSVLLWPRKASDDERRPPPIVGVLFEKDVFLFDPVLGVPLPADLDKPETAMPRSPLTLRQVKQNPELFDAIRRDTDDRFLLTANSLDSVRVELICSTAVISTRMRLLQRDLTDELMAVVHDPLEDSEDTPGLWSRVANHSAATWSEEDMALWAFPERQREGAYRLNDEQRRELSKLTFALAAPRRLMKITVEDNTPKEMNFGKPEKALMKLRMRQVIGEWSDVVQGYLAAQLYEVEPPTSKEIPVVSSDEKRLLRGLIGSRFPEIKRLHELAADNAQFWTAQCQFEQNRPRATIEQCKGYLERSSSGQWANAARSLMANALARQKRWKDAVQVLKDTDPDDLAYAGQRLLINRWNRLLKVDQE